ncbi:MAG: hypothetical protein ACRDHI_09990 [Actinomycetota bacterium]
MSTPSEQPAEQPAEEARPHLTEPQRALRAVVLGAALGALLRLAARGR